MVLAGWEGEAGGGPWCAWVWGYLALPTRHFRGHLSPPPMTSDMAVDWLSLVNDAWARGASLRCPESPGWAQPPGHRPRLN